MGCVINHDQPELICDSCGCHKFNRILLTSLDFECNCSRFQIPLWRIKFRNKVYDNIIIFPDGSWAFGKYVRGL